jgi:two-component system OmpR family response regulator
MAGLPRGQDFTASVAGSAEAAEDVLESGDIGLAVLDVILPDEDGFALCRRLRSSVAPRIITLTALSEPTGKGRRAGVRRRRLRLQSV